MNLAHMDRPMFILGSVVVPAVYLKVSLCIGRRPRRCRFRPSHGRCFGRYLSKEDRLFLCDKELKIVSHELLTSILQYQTAVVRQDFESANKILPTIPRTQYNKIARFLESQGFKEQARTAIVYRGVIVSGTLLLLQPGLCFWPHGAKSRAVSHASACLLACDESSHEDPV